MDSQFVSHLLKSKDGVPWKIQLGGSQLSQECFSQVTTLLCIQNALCIFSTSLQRILRDVCLRLKS